MINNTEGSGLKSTLLFYFLNDEPAAHNHLTNFSSNLANSQIIGSPAIKTIIRYCPEPIPHFKNRGWIKSVTRAVKAVAKALTKTSERYPSPIHGHVFLFVTFFGIIFCIFPHYFFSVLPAGEGKSIQGKNCMYDFKSHP